ncbi:MAG: TonB-dependent receptor domain-containing protein [Prolixibacteraceae bacterium]
MRATSLLKLILFLTVNLLFFYTRAQNVSLSGYVIDGNTGESLVGATVWNSKVKFGTISNNSGFFQMKLSTGWHQLSIQFVGYEAQNITIDIQHDTIAVVSMMSRNMLNEVIVRDDKQQDFLLSPVMSMHQLQAKQINSIPSILGEPDVLKAIQFLPGVSMTNEGQTGMSVRGGNPDQTLVLLDGVPMYNTNHLFGYLSNFNSDYISDGKLYKGGLPARYGGRLSSIFDITSKEGNYHRREGVVSVGTMAGRIMLEGPIKEGKLSYFIAARRTWLDLPIRLAQKMNYDDEITYNFWDVYAKLKWNIDQRNKLMLCTFKGKDQYLQRSNGLTKASDTDFRFSWGNQSVLLKWEHLFANNLYSDISADVSYYDQKLRTVVNSDTSNLQINFNRIINYSVQSNYYLATLNKQKIKFGFKLSQQKLTPNLTNVLNYDLESLNDSVLITSYENAIFFEDELVLSDKMKLNAGTRFSMYRVGTKNYWGIEPRFAFSYHLQAKTTLKLSYSRMKQFIHVLPNTGTGIPVDRWICSTENIEPGKSNLYSAGLFYQANDMLNVSLEGYYSGMTNVVRYKESDYIYQNESASWEEKLLTGKGQAYGMELFVEKSKGRFTGWFSYTLSWSNRIFAQINGGVKFPYTYDRRHQIKVAVNYDLFEKQKQDKQISHTLSTSFSYLSGNYVTFPTQEYEAQALPYVYHRTRIQHYISGINNFKMPDYHRLDLSYRITIDKKDKQNVWNFSVYNVYNRMNVFYIYKEDDGLKQVTYFPIIPSVTFTHKF